MFAGSLCICRAAPYEGGILFISPSLHLCLIFWLTSLCSSNPSLCPQCSYVHLSFQGCYCAYTCTTAQFLRDVWSRECSWKAAELLGRNAKDSPARLSGLSASVKQESRIYLIQQFPLGFVEQCWDWRMKKQLRHLHSESLHCWLIFPFYVLYFSTWPDWLKLVLHYGFGNRQVLVRIIEICDL